MVAFVVVLLVVALVPFVSSKLSAPAAGPGGCIAGIDPVDQVRFGSLIASVESSPAYLSYASGRCFNFTSGGHLDGEPSFVLVHFTPHVWYPCRTFAVHWVDHELQVTARYAANGTLVGLDISPIGPVNAFLCPRLTIPIWPSTLQAQNGTVETVQITLQGSFAENLRDLNATLILPAGNFTATFAPSVSSSSVRYTGSVVLPRGAITTWTGYNMTERATFADGTSFNATVVVQLEG